MMKSQNVYRVYFGQHYCVLGARNVKEAIKKARKFHRESVGSCQRDFQEVTKLEKLFGGDATELKLPPGTNPPQPTCVISRWWGNGVIALFPEMASSVSNPLACPAYTHVRQYGIADPADIIKNSRPATTSEYLPLLRELHKTGRRNLVIRKRQTQDAILRRRSEWLKLCMEQAEPADLESVFQEA